MSFPYGIIGNCRSAALLSGEGSVDWCCMPHFDSPSVFAKILDNKKGGSFSIKSWGKYKIEQSYIKNTNILETKFSNTKNSFKVIDFFSKYRGRRNIIDDSIYRIIEVIKGNPKVKFIFNPKLNYARGKTIMKLKKDFIIGSNKGYKIFLSSNLNLGDIYGGKFLSIPKKSFFILSFNHFKKFNIKKIYYKLEKTRNYWYDFVKKGSWPNKFKQNIIRSALVLKLLSYEESGAVIASPTTSLPESIGGKRNWDYRYCWLRDSSFTIDAFTKICHFDEAKRYMNYLNRVLLSCDISKKLCSLDIQIMYGVNGERKLPERILNHLSGYKNSRPVRVGNAAYKQKQIDTAGEVINTIYGFYVKYRYKDKLNWQMWSLVKHLSQYVIDEWKNKDHGIWEFRKEKDNFTFSKLLCWVALNRSVEIAHFFKKEKEVKEWTEEKNKIRDEIILNYFNKKKGAFTISKKSEYLDASVLLMPYYNFLSGDDKLFKKTLKSIDDELVKGCLVKRYNKKDDFGKPQSAFLICSFWFIDALFLSGNKRRAKKLFKNLLSYCNHLGLLSEDFDFQKKQLSGNFPQAYAHVALINTAILLSERKKDFVCDF